MAPCQVQDWLQNSTSHLSSSTWPIASAYLSCLISHSQPSRSLPSGSGMLLGAASERAEGVRRSRLLAHCTSALEFPTCATTYCVDLLSVFKSAAENTPSQTGFQTNLVISEMAQWTTDPEAWFYLRCTCEAWSARDMAQSKCCIIIILLFNNS